MVYVKKEWPTFTIDELENIAKSCSSKEEFRENFKTQYNYCLKNKISKQIMSFIPHKKKWTKDTLIQEAKKFKTRSEWMYSNISSYNTALKSDFYEECVSHMEKGIFGPVQKWTYDAIKDVYSKYNNLKDLRINNSPAYNTAIRNGWHKDLSQNMDRGWGKGKIKWTFDNVFSEALKYNSIKELQTNSPSAYHTAIRNKWLMDVISHMKGGNTKWTIDKLVDVLSKHPKNKWYKIKECHAAFIYMKRHKLENVVIEKLK